MHSVLARQQSVTMALLERRAWSQSVGGQLPIDFADDEESDPVSYLSIRPRLRSLATGIRSLGMHRTCGTWQLSLDAICAQLHITVTVEDDLPGLQGLALAGQSIVIAARIKSPMQRQWVLAHELGHILVQRGRLPHCIESEEWTADWFARELLVPSAVLGVLAPLTHGAAAAHFGVDVSHLILQRLALAGASEPVVRDGEVLCPRCGHRHLLPRCGCSALRHAMAERSDREGAVTRASERRGRTRPSAREPEALAL